MKSKLLYVATCLLLFSCSFTFNESELTWMWEDKIQVPILLTSMAMVCIGTHIYGRRMV